MKAHITVRQDHIDNGSHNSSQLCPVARGICASLGLPFLSVSVEEDSFTIFSPYTSWSRQPLPDVVRDWVYNYDHGLNVEPFEFDIEVPEQEAE